VAPKVVGSSPISHPRNSVDSCQLADEFKGEEARNHNKRGLGKRIFPGLSG
jgi:hypothetical protein